MSTGGFNIHSTRSDMFFSASTEIIASKKTTAKPVKLGRIYNGILSKTAFRCFFCYHGTIFEEMHSFLLFCSLFTIGWGDWVRKDGSDKKISSTRKIKFRTLDNFLEKH